MGSSSKIVVPKEMILVGGCMCVPGHDWMAGTLDSSRDPTMAQGLALRLERLGDLLALEVLV